MQNGELARSTQRLFRMLRPENVGTAAQTAITWLKPPPSPSGVIGPIRLPGPPATLGRLGALEVRLAEGKRDVKRAQKLRYRVFYKDGAAIADAATLAGPPRQGCVRQDLRSSPGDRPRRQALDRRQAAGGRHLSPAAPGRRGTQWRLLYRERIRHRRPDRASSRICAFSSSAAPACCRAIATSARVELLWHGIWSYVRQHRLDVMIGCASFEGTDPDRLALPLSFLHHYAQAPEAWRASRASLAPRRDEPDGEGSHQSEGRAA